MTTDLAPHVEEITRALGNKLDPETVEDELRKYLDYGVPLAQAKRDIVRNHGGAQRGGRRTLGELMGEERGVDLLVKVQTVNEKEITGKDGTTKKVWFGFLADETKSVAYTAWKDLKLEKGRSYAIKNAYVRTFRDQPDVNLGDYTEVAVSQTAVAAVEGYPRATSGPRPSTTVEVKDIKDGMPNVTVTGRILDAEERQITTQNGPKTIVKGTFADATGQIPFTAWQPNSRLKADAAVTIRSAYVKTWRVPELNLGDSATVESASDVPEADSLAAPRRASIGDLDRAGGGSGVEIEGVVLEVKPGSGLIDRCGQCNRVLQKRECRLHGKVEPVPDLRIKAVLDDGFGALTLIVPKEGTERLLGKSFEACQTLAREAMSKEVIEDEVKVRILGRRLLARGNVTKDEFGLQLIAQGAELAPPRDAKRAAEALLEELSDLGVNL